MINFFQFKSISPLMCSLLAAYPISLKTRARLLSPERINLNATWLAKSCLQNHDTSKSCLFPLWINQNHLWTWPSPFKFFLIYNPPKKICFYQKMVYFYPLRSFRALWLFFQFFLKKRVAGYFLKIQISFLSVFRHFH